ncbi:MAG: SMP-30/gluconolactonase/LRE family protein [Clostridia bacterium]|nr:SMP-30/gluconolactonase/LRE family protein [Clostridia bacterium]
MEILSHKKCIIGEGPVWCEHCNKLYYVNSYGNEICCVDLETKKTDVRRLDFGVAAIAFTKKGEMLISCRDGAFILEDDGTRRPLYDRSRFRIEYGNDAKVGPDGRFYIGTQSSKRMKTGDAIDGKLYCIDKNGEVKVLLDGLLLSNGFDWSMDEKRFYHTDSDTKIIKEYSFHKENGEITFTGRSVKIPGVDGITIDRNDLLYVACWGRGHIAIVDTADMQIKGYIKVPARIPASCGFAGRDMEHLVVVTATLGADPEEDKNAGCTFICDAGAKGRKPYLFG